MVGSCCGRGVRGELGQEPARVDEPLLDLTLRMLEELAHLTCGRGVKPTRPECIDEVPVARLRWNPARARVRLREEPLGFERRHVVADRGRRYLETRQLGDRAGTDRLRGVDKALNDGSQNRRLSLVHRVLGSRVLNRNDIDPRVEHSRRCP